MEVYNAYRDQTERIHHVPHVIEMELQAGDKKLKLKASERQRQVEKEAKQQAALEITHREEEKQTKTSKRQQTTQKQAQQIPRLSVWRPRDHFRLLWWVLWQPQGLLSYCEYYGKQSEMPVGNWLVSTLVWLPLLLPLLALSLGGLPITEKAWLAEAYLKWAAVVTIAWLVTGLLGNRDIEGLDSLVFIMALSISLGTTAGVAFALATDMVLSIAFGMALGVAFGVAFGVAGVMVGVVAFGVELGVVGGIAGSLTFGVAFVMAVGLAVGLEGVVKKTLKTGQPSLVARTAFIALILSHAFLWFYCLGGWRVFVV